MGKKIFRVFIIESPSAVDLYHHRFEGEALKETLRLAGINATHHLTVDFESFAAAFLVDVMGYLKSGKSIPMPIIHISAHGGENGIQLTDKEEVTWEFISKLLQPINDKIGGSLLLSLSSCKGFSGCKMAMKTDTPPFGAVIGNTGEPTWSETNIAFGAFYHRFAAGAKVKDCVEAMRQASGNLEFQLISSRESRDIFLEALGGKKPSPKVEDINKSLVGNVFAKELKKDAEKTKAHD